jgi:hypothetical protein
MRQAVGWLTPIASARRTEEIPLSDCRMSQSPVNQTRSGNLVECNGVRVVAVNWNIHDSRTDRGPGVLAGQRHVQQVLLSPCILHHAANWWRYRGPRTIEPPYAGAASAMPQARPAGCPSSGPWGRRHEYRPRCSRKIGSTASQTRHLQGFRRQGKAATLVCRVTSDKYQ